MGRLDNKHVVITGAAGGVGAAASRIFCREGASVVGVDIATEAGVELEKELRGDGFDFSFHTVDVSSEEQVAALAATVTATRDVDVLYNNAGIILGKSILESTVEDWDRQHDVNSKSVFLMIKAFAPRMTNPGGSIINTSSAGGVIALPDMSIYGAAKAGVAMLSKVAAVDLAPGIRVNALIPGLVDTPLPHSFVSDFPDEVKTQVIEGMKAMHLTGRMARPEEIALAALFLASDDSSFVTGSALVVDGGASTR